MKEVKSTLHPCPQCKAGENEPCRTPTGRLAKRIHSFRQYSIELPEEIVRGMSEPCEPPPGFFGRLP